MVILDSSIINVAVPSIQDGLSLNNAQMSWVVDGYLVAFGGLLLLGGRLADVLRRRAVFLAGLALFTLASVVCALAPSGAVLIGARVVQGAGGAVMAPAALSIVMLLFPGPADRSRALGLWGGVSGAGGIAGVLLGGLLSQTLGWPWVFLINVPVGLLVGALVLYSIRPFRAGGGSFDAVGALGVTVSMAASAYGLANGAHAGWSDPATLTALVTGAVALGAFLVAERRVERPLIPLRVFRNRRLAVASAMTLLVGAVTVGLFFFLPQYQQLVLGMSPLTTSLAQLPIALAVTAGSLLAPRLATAVGVRTALTAALASLALGLLWLAPASTGVTAVGLLGPFLLTGTGIGLSFVHLTTLAVGEAGTGEAGLVSGMVNVSRQMGGALGLAALAGVSASATATPDFSAVFLTTAALTAFALLLSLTRPPARRPGAR
ncbi:MFS transporter [Streptomyces sp. NBC_01012]|uniref:MFS transporter n=1 Tax=Streptomyces sp. NBC_01012 TaxID=2903717 RepID=UPI00386C6BFF